MKPVRNPKTKRLYGYLIPERGIYRSEETYYQMWSPEFQCPTLPLRAWSAILEHTPVIESIEIPDRVNKLLYTISLPLARQKSFLFDPSTKTQKLLLRIGVERHYWEVEHDR